MHESCHCPSLKIAIWLMSSELQLRNHVIHGVETSHQKLSENLYKLIYLQSWNSLLLSNSQMPSKHLFKMTNPEFLRLALLGIIPLAYGFFFSFIQLQNLKTILKSLSWSHKEKYACYVPVETIWGNLVEISCGLNSLQEIAKRLKLEKKVLATGQRCRWLRATHLPGT